MEPYTTKAAKRNPRGEMLVPTMLGVHPDLYKSIDTVDRTQLEKLVKAVLEIGSPQECRARITEFMRTTEPIATREWALDGALGTCPYGLAVPALARDHVDGHGPTTYEGGMAAVSHKLHDASRALQQLLETHFPVDLAGTGKPTRRARCFVPARLLERLLPMLYTWVVDWEFFCTYTAVWASVADFFTSLCPHRTIYTCANLSEDDDATAHTVATDTRQWVQLCTLPWKPLLDIIVSLAVRTQHSHLSVDPSSDTWELATHTGRLYTLATQARCFFGPDALAGVWQCLAPKLSGCQDNIAETRLYVRLLGALLPVAHLSTVPLAGCRFPGSEDAVAPPEPQPVLFDMIAATLDMCQQAGQRAARDTVPMLALTASIAVHNVGLVSWDSYAEPLFTVLLSSLNLPTSQSPQKLDGTATVAQLDSAIESIAYGLPAHTTSPLWNHLRRFLHAVQPLLRPDTTFHHHAARVHGCLTALVKRVASRLSAQSGADRARRLTRVWPHTALHHWTHVSSHCWTAATANAFADLLAPVLMPALAMEVPDRTKAVEGLVHLAPTAMLPHMTNFLATSLSGQDSDMALRVSLTILHSITAPLLECADTQVPFLSLCKTIADGVVEKISVSTPQVTAAVLRWLGVVAAVTPLDTLTDRSTPAEVTWVRDVVYRVLKTTRGVTPMNADLLEYAAAVTLFLDGASDAAFAGAVELIAAECRLESNGCFAHAVARQCALRTPEAFLPLLEVAAGPLRAAYAAGRESQVRWAISLAASVIAGCGFHVQPHVALIVECVECQLRSVEHSASVDTAAELVHQLVRALTRRRCLGKGRRVLPTPTPDANTLYAIPCATDDDDDDADEEDDEMDQPDAPQLFHGQGGGDVAVRSTGVPLWLGARRDVTVMWEDPTEAQAACGAQLLARLLTQAMDFLRDPSRPSCADAADATTTTTTTGLDALRGLQTGGHHAWQASRVVQGVMAWVAELWGAGTYLYASCSLEALQADAYSASPVGTALWHDAEGRPLAVDRLAVRLIDPRSRNPAPASTLRAIAQYPCPCSDAELAALLIDVVLPRFGGDVVDLTRLLPESVLAGVVNLPFLKAMNASATDTGPGRSGVVQQEEDGGAGDDEETDAEGNETAAEAVPGVSTVSQAHAAVMEQVAFLLSDLVNSTHRVAGSDDNLLVAARHRVLARMGRTASRRRSIGLFAETAALEEVCLYMYQWEYSATDPETQTRLFQALQLLVLCPHRVVHLVSARAMTCMYMEATPAVSRLVAHAVANFFHRVLVATHQLAPDLTQAEMAGPLLVDDAMPISAATDSRRTPCPSLSSACASPAPLPLPLAALPSTRAQKALINRLRPYLNGLFRLSLGLIRDGTTGGDGTVLIRLFSAVSRISSVFFKSTDAMLLGGLGDTFKGGPSQGLGMTSTEAAVVVTHAIRLAWADAPVAPHRSVLSLLMARHFCTPTLRLFFWRQNHAEPALARHAGAAASTSAAASAAVLPPALFAQLTQLAGNASPSLSGAALHVLVPQWLIFLPTPPTTRVLVRVAADGSPCAMDLSASSAPFFYERAITLCRTFTAARCGAVSRDYLPRTMDVPADAETVRQACAGVDLVMVDADEPECICVHTFAALRAAPDDDPASEALAAAQAQYRSHLQAWVRRAAGRGVTASAVSAAVVVISEASQAVPLRQSWVWRLVRWYDEVARHTQLPTRQVERCLWPLLAMALGNEAARPLFSEVMTLALDDAIADAHGGTGPPHGEAGALVVAHAPARSDKLQSSVLCLTAMRAACALVETAQLGSAHGSASPSSPAAEREAALALLRATIVNLCDWRHSHDAADAAIAHRHLLWELQSLNEARQTMHFLFDRLDSSFSWPEQNVCSALLCGFFQDVLCQDAALWLVSEAADRLRKNELFFLSAGATHEVNMPVGVLKRLLSKGDVAPLLEAQLHHVDTCEALSLWALARVDAALTAIENTTVPVAELNSAHRQDLAVIKSCLGVLPFPVPSPPTGESVRRSVLLAVRALDLALPQVDSTAQAAEKALLADARRPLAKDVAHDVLDLFCDLLSDGRAPLAGAARTKTVLGWALEEFLYRNLHRIGKYAAMQRIASAAQACMAHKDSRVQAKGCAIMSALVYVATNEQVRALSSAYVAELREVRARALLQSPQPEPAHDASADATTEVRGTATAERLANTRRGDGATAEVRRPTMTRQQLSVVMALCGILLAYPTDFPSFVPGIMRQLTPFASVPMSQSVVRHTFRSWWDSHRREWQTVYRTSFSTDDAHAFSALWNANYYA